MKRKTLTSKLSGVLGVLLYSFFMVSCENNQEELSLEQDYKGGSTELQKNTTLPNRFQYYCGDKDNDKIITASSSSGIGNWSSGRYVPRVGLTKTHISGAQFGSKVAIVYRGRRNTGKIYYAVSNNGTDFGSERTVPGAQTTTDGNIKTVSKDGNLYVFHRGRSSSRRVFMSKFDGANWTTSRPATPSMTFNDFDVVENNGVFILTMIGNINLTSFRSVTGLNFENLNTINIPYPFFQSPGNAKNISITSRRDFRGFNHIIIRTDKNELWTSSFNNSLVPNTFKKVEVRLRDPAKTDQRPGIATNGNQVILAYEGDGNNNVYYAYRNGVFWKQTKTGVKTKNSGVDLLYID